MCFTPIVSLSVAIIEFILAAILLAKFKKSTLRNFFAILICILGLYQFTEFMLCITDYSIIWAKIGFMTYGILPAVGLHAILRIYKRKTNLALIYTIPVIFSVLALIVPNFITSAQCTTVFVEVVFMFGKERTFLQSIPFLIYGLYYFGFIMLTIWIAVKEYLKKKQGPQKSRDLAIFIGIIAMFVPTFIVMVLFPHLGMRFPSVLCGFAILTAICVFIAAYFENKSSRK